MAYMIQDKPPAFYEKLFDQQRPRYRDPRQIPINIKETPKTYVIEAAIPGLSKEDIRVKVYGDVLTIYVPTEEEKAAEGKQEGKAAGQVKPKQAQQPAKQEEPDTKYHRREITKRYAPRQIRLPQDANTNDVKAEYTDGILTIIIMRDPEEKGQKRSINVH